MNSDQECTTFVGSLGLISPSNFNYIEMVDEFWPRMHNMCR